MLSINDRPLAREAFARFSIEEVPVTYTVGARHHGGLVAGELIVTNLVGQSG